MQDLRRFAGIATLALLGGCHGQDPDPVVLALDDQVVRRSEFERHVASLEAQGGEKLSAAALPGIFETYIEERILVLEARARGLLTNPAGPTEEQEAVQKLLRDEVLKGSEISKKDVVTYYEAHPDEFDIAPTVTLRQILVATEAEARDVQRRLQKDPKGFEALARRVSKGPEGPNGGLMGVFPRGQLPLDLEAAAFALPAGGLSDVVHTPLGYHILRVDSRTDARRQGLDEAEGRIRGVLLRESSDQKVREFVSALMARAKVNHAAAHLRR